MFRLDPNTHIFWSNLGNMAGSAITKGLGVSPETGKVIGAVIVIGAGWLIKIMQGLFEDRRDA